MGETEVKKLFFTSSYELWQLALQLATSIKFHYNKNIMSILEIYLSNKNYKVIPFNKIKH